MQVSAFIAPANKNFLLRVALDAKAGTAQHGFGASAIRDPPIGWILRVAIFDEVHFGEAGVVEDGALPKWIIRLNGRPGAAAALH